MDQSLVSVIIPTYNRAHLVGKAIESVLSQDHDAVEVLVVDDGSKDETEAFMARTYGDNPKVRYLRKPNGGVASARNLGLREAKGAFIGLLDADDEWLPNKLRLQLAALAAFPDAGMVWSDMAAVNEAGEILHERYLRKMYSAYKYFPTAQDLFGPARKEAQLEGVSAFCGDIFSPMVLGNLVHTSTVLLRRERALKAGEFNEKYRTGEDYPFHLKTCREGPVAYVDAVTIRYAIGLADALSAPDKLIQIATHFVQTLEQTLASEKNQIRLPKALISDRLAEAYSWAGQEHLKAGKTAQARAYFAKSLRAKPSSISNMKSLTISLLPSGAVRGLRSLKRSLKG
jgi:glycosyltransferase involved in cell wall biosynthesis